MAAQRIDFTPCHAIIRSSARPGRHACPIPPTSRKRAAPPPRAPAPKARGPGAVVAAGAVPTRRPAWRRRALVSAVLVLFVGLGVAGWRLGSPLFRGEGEGGEA